MSREYVSTKLTDEMTTQERMRARALRMAFAVVGELIAGGFIEVDLSEREWWERFELALVDVAAQLNTFEG